MNHRAARPAACGRAAKTGPSGFRSVTISRAVANFSIAKISPGKHHRSWGAAAPALYRRQINRRVQVRAAPPSVKAFEVQALYIVTGFLLRASATASSAPQQLTATEHEDGASV